MVWFLKELPRDGDKRKRHGFLWLPKCTHKECRWLTPATWIEMFSCNYVNFEDYPYCWKIIEWED